MQLNDALEMLRGKLQCRLDYYQARIHEINETLEDFETLAAVPTGGPTAEVDPGSEEDAGAESAVELDPPSVPASEPVQRTSSPEADRANRGERLSPDGVQARRKAICRLIASGVDTPKKIADSLDSNYAAIYCAMNVATDLMQKDMESGRWKLTAAGQKLAGEA